LPLQILSVIMHAGVKPRMYAKRVLLLNWFDKYGSYVAIQ